MGKGRGVVRRGIRGILLLGVSGPLDAHGAARSAWGVLIQRAFANEGWLASAGTRWPDLTRNRGFGAKRAR